MVKLGLELEVATFGGCEYEEIENLQTLTHLLWTEEVKTKVLTLQHNFANRDQKFLLWN